MSDMELLEKIEDMKKVLFGWLPEKSMTNVIKDTWKNFEHAIESREHITSNAIGQDPNIIQLQWELKNTQNTEIKYLYVRAIQGLNTLPLDERKEDKGRVLGPSYLVGIANRKIVSVERSS